MGHLCLEVSLWGDLLASDHIDPEVPHRSAGNLLELRRRDARLAALGNDSVDSPAPLLDEAGATAVNRGHSGFEGHFALPFLSTASPAGEVRYRCIRLLGLSGMVHSNNPAFIKGRR